MHTQDTKLMSGIRMFPDGRMDTESAALYLGRSPKTLAVMRCLGTGPSYIKRGRIFYFKEDLDAWLNEGGRIKSTAQSAKKLRKVA